MSNGFHFQREIMGKCLAAFRDCLKLCTNKFKKTLTLVTGQLFSCPLKVCKAAV